MERTSRYLVVEVDVGGAIEVVMPPEHANGGVVRFVLMSKSGRRARLQISAPPEITIDHDGAPKRAGQPVDFLKNC